MGVGSQDVVPGSGSGDERLSRQESLARTLVQLIAITSAVLPVMGAIKVLVAAEVSGLPPYQLWQAPIQTFVWVGVEALALPAFLFAMVLAGDLAGRARYIRSWGWAEQYQQDPQDPRLVIGPGGVARFRWGFRSQVRTATAQLTKARHAKAASRLFFAGAAVGAVAGCAVGPFPQTLFQTVAYGALLWWILHQVSSDPMQSIPVGRLAIAVILAATVGSIGAGLDGQIRPAVYVSFDSSSPNQPGWYSNLSGYGTDPQYLVRCSDEVRIVAPWSTITSIDSPSGADNDTSLWHAYRTGAWPRLGEAFACPKSNVPPPGVIWFGTSYSTSTYELSGRADTFPRSGSIALVARLSRLEPGGQGVDMLVDGVILNSYTLSSDSTVYGWTTDAEQFQTGSHKWTLQEAGGRTLATGTLTITP